MQRFVRHLDFTALALALVVAGALWGFVGLADEVMEGDSRAFDRAIILALRHADDRSDPLGPLWFEEAVRDITAIGSFAVLLLATLVGAGLLALQRRWRTVLLLIVAVGGGQVVSSLLKEGFARDRPDLVPHGMEVLTASFPSGHSLMSAVTWLTLAAILAQTRGQRRTKFYLVGVAMALAVLVGVSRVYLGVHWPTDVLAGWSIGAAWAVMVWLIARWLQRRRQIEPEGGEEANQPA